MKRTLAALAASLLAMLAFAAPASATEPDPHFATGEWQLRDWAGPYPNVETSAAAESTADCDEVVLAKPDTAEEPVVYPPTGNGDVGTSYENTDLDLALPDGGDLMVDYVLSEEANAGAGAVRMFAYGTADADTLNAAPTYGPAIAPDGVTSGTLELVLGGPVTIRTFGLTYDASNDTEGTATFTNLRVVVSLPEQTAVTTPISFCPEPAPETTEPATTTTAGAPAAPQLAKTGANLGMVIVGGVVLLVIGGVFVAFARRRRNIVP